MSTIEVMRVTKDTIVKTGERFLNVEAVITDGKVKHPRSYGYPLDTPKKVIEADMAKAVKLYDMEKAQAAAAEETVKEDKAADKTIEALNGTKITN